MKYVANLYKPNLYVIKIKRLLILSLYLTFINLIIIITFCQMINDVHEAQAHVKER